jgi:hypothetical protein
MQIFWFVLLNQTAEAALYCFCSLLSKYNKNAVLIKTYNKIYVAV